MGPCVRARGRRKRYSRFRFQTATTFAGMHWRSRRTLARVFAATVRPPKSKRAQGMPGAWCARSRACSVESTRVSHHGHTGNTRHSPRNGFNGFLRALPGDRAFLSPSPHGSLSAKLDAGVEASGPHDFAVREISALVRSAIRVHRIPPRVRDDRDTPLVSGQDGAESAADLGIRSTALVAADWHDGQISWPDRLLEGYATISLGMEVWCRSS
jgi:hypothetical protein